MNTDRVFGEKGWGTTFQGMSDAHRSELSETLCYKLYDCCQCIENKTGGARWCFNQYVLPIIRELGSHVREVDLHGVPFHENFLQLLYMVNDATDDNLKKNLFHACFTTFIRSDFLTHDSWRTDNVQQFENFLREFGEILPVDEIATNKWLKVFSSVNPGRKNNFINICIKLESEGKCPELTETIRNVIGCPR